MCHSSDHGSRSRHQSERRANDRKAVNPTVFKDESISVRDPLQILSSIESDCPQSMGLDGALDSFHLDPQADSFTPSSRSGSFWRNSEVCHQDFGYDSSNLAESILTVPGQATDSYLMPSGVIPDSTASSVPLQTCLEDIDFSDHWTNAQLRDYVVQHGACIDSTQIQESRLLLDSDYGTIIPIREADAVLHSKSRQSEGEHSQARIDDSFSLERSRIADS